MRIRDLRYLISFLILAVLIYSPLLAQQPELTAKCVTGQLSLKFKDSVSPQIVNGLVKTNIPSLDTLLKTLKVYSIRPIFPYEDNLSPGVKEAYFRHQLDRHYLIKFPDTIDLSSAKAVLATDANLVAISRNVVCEPMEIIPNDSLFPTQWALKDVNAPTGDIKATYAWELSRGAAGVRIAILDTGIDTAHWELKNSVITGWNVPDSNTNTHDQNGHGTGMAGSIGARHDIRGVAGIAPYCKIIPIKLDALGHADQGFCDVQAAEGVFKARALGAKVINMSFGFPQGGCGFDSTTSSLRDAIEFAAESALCVTGMGNFNSDYPLFPAAWDSVIAVGGTKPGGLRWKPHPTTPPCTSPPGPEQSFYCDCYVYGSNYGNHIDVVAPARMVMTTWLIDSAAYTDKFCGTSHSAAIVSAIAGLIYSQDLLLGIGLSPFQVKEVIEKSADDTAFCGYCDPENPVGWDQYHGWGKVNAYHALVAISRGDANNDKTINQQDVDYLISYWLGGPPPVPHKGLADVDCSGAFSMVDIIYLNNFVNNGGPRPLICYKFNYP